MRQGAHQVAQKSTSTGWPEPSTSVSKSSSVTGEICSDNCCYSLFPAGSFFFSLEPLELVPLSEPFDELEELPETEPLSEPVAEVFEPSLLASLLTSLLTSLLPSPLPSPLLLRP